jgi:hypothetical protein
VAQVVAELAGDAEILQDDPGDVLGGVGDLLLGVDDAEERLADA